MTRLAYSGIAVVPVPHEKAKAAAQVLVGGDEQGEGASQVAAQLGAIVRAPGTGEERRLRTLGVDVDRRDLLAREGRAP